jgi:hypothetical protein
VRTAPRRARSRLRGAQIVKSLVFSAAAHRRRRARADERGESRRRGAARGAARRAHRQGGPDVRTRTHRVRDRGVPPIAHVRPLETLIDEDLLRLEVLWAAAGHPNSLFRLTPDELCDERARRPGGMKVGAILLSARVAVSASASPSPRRSRRSRAVRCSCGASRRCSRSRAHRRRRPRRRGGQAARRAHGLRRGRRRHRRVGRGRGASARTRRARLKRCPPTYDVSPSRLRPRARHPEVCRSCGVGRAGARRRDRGGALEDTLKRATLGIVEQTVPRAGLWRAQTPQVFRRAWLEEAHRSAVGVATDDAALLEAVGVPCASPRATR